mgnify:CR=1 FL=1
MEKDEAIIRAREATEGVAEAMHWLRHGTVDAMVAGGAEAPFAYMGVHICRPDYVADGPDGPFSLSGFWRRSVV